MIEEHLRIRNTPSELARKIIGEVLSIISSHLHLNGQIFMTDVYLLNTRPKCL